MALGTCTGFMAGKTSKTLLVFNRVGLFCWRLNLARVISRLHLYKRSIQMNALLCVWSFCIQLSFVWFYLHRKINWLLFRWDNIYFACHVRISKHYQWIILILNMIPEHEFLGVGVEICLPHQIFDLMFINMMTYQSDRDY